MKQTPIVIATTLSIALFLAGVPGAHAGEWEWEVVPYIWAPDIGVDISLNETDILSTTFEFSDMVDKVDLAGLVHFEGRTGRGGFFVDVVYLSLSDDQTSSGSGPIPAGTRTDAELEQLLGETGGIFRLTSDGPEFDLLFGVRVTDVSFDASFDFPDTSLIADRSRTSEETLLDGFVGLRFSADFAKRWLWSIRGDVGAGDTDLTWQGVLTVGVKLGKSHDKALYLGYRHLVYEFDAGSSGITGQELEFSGPAFGFGFSF